MEESSNIPSTNLKPEDEVVPILFNIPVGMASRYAHHMLVQAGEHEVTISFFEMYPPLAIDSATQLSEAKKGVRADCIARVAIAKGRYPEFVKALNRVLEKSEAGE